MDESTEVDTCSTDSNHMEKLEIGQEETIVKCTTDPSVPRQHSLNSESGEFIRCLFNIVVYSILLTIRKCSLICLLRQTNICALKFSTFIKFHTSES